MIQYISKLAFHQNRTKRYLFVVTFTLLVSLLIYSVLEFYFDSITNNYETKFAEDSRSFLKQNFSKFADEAVVLINQELDFIESDTNLLKGVASAFIERKVRFKSLFELSQKVPSLKNKKVRSVKDLEKLNTIDKSIVIPLNMDSKMDEAAVNQTALMDLYVPNFLEIEAASKSYGFSFVDTEANYARVYGDSFIQQAVKNKSKYPLIFKPIQRKRLGEWIGKKEERPLYYVDTKNSELSILRPLANHEIGFSNKYIVSTNDLSKIKKLLSKIKYNSEGVAYLFEPESNFLFPSKQGYLGRGADTLWKSFKKGENFIKIEGREFYINFSDLAGRYFINEFRIKKKSLKIGFLIPTENLTTVFTPETKKMLKEKRPSLQIALGFALFILTMFSIFHWILYRSKSGLKNVISKLDSDYENSLREIQRKDDFFFIKLSMKRMKKKVDEQEAQIQFLEGALDNTVSQLSEMIEIFIDDINYVFDTMSKDEAFSNSLLSEVFKSVIKLNQLQSNIVKLQADFKNENFSIDEEKESNEPEKIEYFFDQEKRNTFNKVYLVGFDQSTFNFLQVSLNRQLKNPEIKNYVETEKVEFYDDRKVLFLLNPNIRKEQIDAISSLFLKNPNRFLVSFLDSRVSPLASYAPKFLKPLVNNRILLLNNFLKIKDLYELSIANLHFKKLTEFTESIYEENKIEIILNNVLSLIGDLFPNLVVIFSRKEKYVIPEEEEMTAENKDHFNLIRDRYFKQDQKVYEFSERNKYYFCAEYQGTKNILMMIECEDEFGTIQRAILNNIYNITNNRLQNFNPLVQDPNYVNIIRKIINDFDRIEFIKASRQYSVLQYSDKNKTSKIERIPLYVLADYLKGYFFQVNRSYLINPSKVKKINYKDKKYIIPLSDEDTVIYSKYLKEFQTLFPYWFSNIED